MFTTLLTPQEASVVVAWTFGLDNLITSKKDSNTTAQQYEGRITLFRSNGSLELRNLTVNDSGEYEVAILPPNAGIIRGSTILEMHGEQISKFLQQISVLKIFHQTFLLEKTARLYLGMRLISHIIKKLIGAFIDRLHCINFSLIILKRDCLRCRCSTSLFLSSLCESYKKYQQCEKTPINSFTVFKCKS